MTKSKVSLVLSVFAVGIGFFAGGFGPYFVPIQIGALIDGLGLSESLSGLLGAVEVASMSLTAIIISPKLASWSRSRTAIYGVIFAAACEIATGFASSLSLLFPLRIFVGIGCGLVFGSICATAASGKNPDRILGAGQAIMNFLFLFMFLLMPYALAYAQLKGLFFALGFVLLMTIPFLRFLNDENVNTDADEISGKKANRLLIAMHLSAVVLLNIGLGALWGFVERLGTDSIGLSPETIGKVLSAATLFMIAGSLFAAWLGVRIGRTIPVVSATILCAVAAMLVTNAETLIIYAAGLFLYNAAYLFLGPYTIAGISSALDPSGRLAAAVGGVMFFSYSVGIGTGGFIAELISLSGIGILTLSTCLLAAPLFAIVTTQLEKEVH
jgi:predicted MFS family arabinose efflux permease